ncbi:hypothetical protein O181_121650 [Austropuccinia psidii MF-1]|uniref:Tc1-like transposase DDE domain-containing protein n=1 Tax=Austropuccinia psidii MF-1 TaxID=1389203 RepID=A0A9Q3KMN0_9BASI|nr:hypothetical protein [Austropuccinia psidii MF-1]
MGVPKSTVHDTIRRFQENGSCADRPKTGQPPSTKEPLVFLDGTQTASTFIEKVYEPHLQSFYNYIVNAPYIRTRDCIAMMEDGAPIHMAQTSNKWRAANQIDKLPWPPQSYRKRMESHEDLCNKTSPALHHGQTLCSHSELLGRPLTCIF